MWHLSLAKSAGGVVFGKLGSILAEKEVNAYSNNDVSWYP